MAEKRRAHERADHEIVAQRLESDGILERGSLRGRHLHHLSTLAAAPRRLHPRGHFEFGPHVLKIGGGFWRRLVAKAFERGALTGVSH